jgi:predicted AlkP superfamily phosphohydrolase/phosphomutase
MATSKKTTKKLLIIGIDGGTLDVILPMVKSGKLPILGHLLHTGAYGTLFSTIPPVTAPAWSTFITGKNPGRHGVFSFFQKCEHRLGALSNFRCIKADPFWRSLNANGLKVGLINIPLTYPPDKVDGFIISGMLVPPGAVDYIYPSSIFSKLHDYHVDLDGLMEQNEWQTEALVKKNREKFVRNVFHLTRTRADNTLKLMREEPWEFFMVVFTGSDRICHFFWGNHNADHSYSSFVEDYYIFLDSIIGELIEEAGEDTVKIIMSDHGFGSAPTKVVNLCTLSRLLGDQILDFHFWERYLTNRFLAKLNIIEKVALRDLLELDKCKIVFEPLYANFFGISINMKSEHKTDFVSGTKAYERYRENIITKLKTLKDPTSGEAMVVRVMPKEFVYEGKFSNQAPDLVVQLAYKYRPQFNPLRRRLIYDIKERLKTGEHRMEGLFIASGPQIQPGRLERELLIQDVAPTILYLLNTPIPNNYDGHLITELFSKAYLDKNVPQYRGVENLVESQSDRSDIYTQEEFDESKKLLENLGYL